MPNLAGILMLAIGFALAAAPRAPGASGLPQNRNANSSGYCTGRAGAPKPEPEITETITRRAPSPVKRCRVQRPPRPAR